MADFAGPDARVVLLAYYYPPLVGIASERAASFCRHLSRLGWEPVVITARNGFYHRAASESEPLARAIRTRSVELSRVFRKGYAVATRSDAVSDSMTFRPVETGDIGAAARRLVHEFVYVPDSQVGWIPFAARAASGALDRSGNRQVIFSTSSPYSAHLAAMRVARRMGLPWVAEFRDPWSTDRSPNLPHLRLRRRFDRSIEAGIVRTADHVTVVSKSFREEMLAAHPDLAPADISVVTNGFEPMPAGHPPPLDEPMRIVYAGTVVPPERVDPILTGLDRVHERHPGAFRLRVVGPPEPWKAATSPHRWPPWLELRGVVSADAARRAVADASALLLLQRHPAFRVALPGKMFGYIGARRPIVALVPPGSEMEAVLRAHADVRFVRADEPDGFVAAVELLLKEHQQGRLLEPRVPLAAIAPLERREQVAKLAEIFARVLESTAHGATRRPARRAKRITR